MKLLVCGYAFCIIWCNSVFATNEKENSAEKDGLINKNGHATILVYHHVSKKTPPSTSISPQKFEEHLDYIKENHNVISLNRLVDHLKKSTDIPDKSVVITFDDGFSNILHNAHPLLRKFEFPYTIFVNPSEVGSGKSHLSWSQLQMMSQQDVLIANHYWDHRHLLDNAKESNWLNVTRKHILDAEEAIKKNIGTSPGFIAYPFGEFNQELTILLKDMGITGFAQHSGGVSHYTDLTQIPRFPAAGIYANLKTLKVKLNSLGMPVLRSSISDPAWYTAPDVEYSLTLNTADFSATQFNCFFKGEKAILKWQQDNVTVSSKQRLMPGRSRVNCTVPSISKPGRFYWHSQPWFVADEHGKWLD